MRRLFILQKTSAPSLAASPADIAAASSQGWGGLLVRLIEICYFLPKLKVTPVDNSTPLQLPSLPYVWHPLHVSLSVTNTWLWT